MDNLELYQKLHIDIDNIRQEIQKVQTDHEKRISRLEGIMRFALPVLAVAVGGIGTLRMLGL